MAILIAIGLLAGRTDRRPDPQRPAALLGNLRQHHLFEQFEGGNVTKLQRLVGGHRIHYSVLQRSILFCLEPFDQFAQIRDGELGHQPVQAAAYQVVLVITE